MNGNNLNNTNIENLAGVQNIENLLSTVNAKKIGKKFAKELASELERTIKESDPLGKGIDSYSKSLKTFTLDIQKTLKDSGFDKATENKINSALRKAEKEADSLKKRMSEVSAAIRVENEKDIKDVDKLLKLYSEYVGIQNEFNLANSTTTQEIELQVKEAKDLHTQQELNAKAAELTALQYDLQYKKKKNVTKEEKEHLKVLEKEVETLKNKVLVNDQDNNNTRKNLSETKANINSISDLDKKRINQYKDNINGLDKQSKSVFETWKAGTTTIVNNIKNVFSLWNDLFNNTETWIDNFNQEFGERWKIKNDISKNIGGDDFDSYQKSVYNSVNSGSMRGMFNEKELKEHLKTMSDYLFDSKEATIENSQLIAYGNKFLGMTNQSMQSLYNLEKLTNGDGFIRSQLETITKLQNSGLITNEAQLDKLTIMASQYAQDLTGLGLGAEQAQDLTNSITEMSAVLDNKMYEGAGQEVSNAIVEALKSPETGVQLFGSQYQQALQIANNGGADVAWRLLDLMQNSEFAQMSNKLSSGGLNVTSAVAGREFANYNLFNKVSGNWDEIQAERSNLAGMSGDYLTKSMEDDSKEVDAETKRLNKKAIDLANGNYTELIKQAESTQHIETYVKNIDTAMKIVTGALSVLSGIESATKLFGDKGSGGLGLGGKFGNFFGGAGNKAGIGTGTKVLGGLSLAAGLARMGMDAISAGTGGMVDQDGNTVIGPGGKSAWIGALGGNKINTESYNGKLTSTAKAENTTNSMLSGAGKGALIGAGIGSFIPGVGTVIGGAIGGVVGGIGGLIAGDQKNKEAQELAKKQYEEIKKQTEIDQEMLEIAKRGNAALAYRYAIDTSVMGNMGALGESGVGVIATGGRGASNSSSYPWKVTSGYHDGRTLSNGDSSAHNGIDFGIPVGTPIGSPVNGTVVSAQVDSRNTYPNGSKSGGTWIYILGDDGITYGFGHLSSIAAGLTKKGAKVSAGQQIALSGNTGYSTGAHLHFSTKSGGSWVDPSGYINQGLFSPSGEYFSSDSVTNSSSSDTSDTIGINMNGTMRIASNMNYVRGSMGDVQSQGMDVGPILSALEQVNNTIRELGEKQDAQQRILDALTVKSIPNLGI